jgi:hypothetical protein
MKALVSLGRLHDNQLLKPLQIGSGFYYYVPIEIFV